MASRKSRACVRSRISLVNVYRRDWRQSSMNRYLACRLRVAFCAVALLSNGFGQQPTTKPKKQVRGVHQVVSRAPGEMLAQLNDSLQQLASKVSPAVVQIEVTGFGSVSSADRKELALVVRQ